MVLSRERLNLTTLCSGESVILKTAAATSYQWFKDGSKIASGTAPNIEVSNSGSYTVVATNNSGCASAISAAAVVIVNPLPPTPVVTASGNTSICEGSSVLLATSAANAYQWFKNGSPVSEGRGQSFSASTAGTYTVVVTNSNGCASAASQPVTVFVRAIPATPVVTLSGNTTFCSGGKVVLTANSGSSLQWLLNDTPIPGANTDTYTATVGGNYTVVAINNNGCVSTPSIATSVTVNPSPSIPLITTTGGTAVCTGGSVLLTASAATGYQWFKDGVGIDGATSQAYTATSAGMYTVVVTNNSGCTSPVSMATTIVQNPATQSPVVTASGNTSFCAGGSVLLKASAGTTYQWYMGGSPISGATAQTFEANASANYSVLVTNSNGCNSGTSSPVAVVVNTMPKVPVVIANGPTTFCKDQFVILSTPRVNELQYQWLLNGTVLQGATTDTLRVSDEGSYSVRTTNSSGCATTSTATATYISCANGIYMPTVFTPNQDGKNDIVKPSLPGMGKFQCFKIYNRWGNLVFETFEKGKGWDGTLKGTPQPDNSLQR